MKFEWKIIGNKNLVFDAGKAEITKGINCIISDLNPCTLESVKGEMQITLNKNEKIFVNGYQTWTTCPEYDQDDSIRGLHNLPKALIDHYSFDRYGDYHFVDYPYKKGILHGFSYCYIRRGEFYRLFASLDETNGYTMFTIDTNAKTMTIERDCQGLHAEDKFHAFDLFYAEGTEDDVFDAWFEALNIHPRTQKQLYGYSSWYNRYQDINEEAIRQDLQGCTAIFEKGDLFQIDDGWEPFIGDWLEADQNKFPDGMKAMADEIHEKGYLAGIWLAPFVAEEKSSLFQNHPDWFYMHENKPWKGGCNWSGYYALDLDNPEVTDYLKDVFHQVLDVWGYDLVKLDFLYAIAAFGNEKETRAARMIRAMKLLRELCGEKLILGCGVPVMPAFGLVDYCRISCDVTLDWNDKMYMRICHRERPSTRNAVSNILSRRHLNNRAYLSDPDVFFLREENTSLTDQQKDSLAKIDALLGGVFLTSDDPSNYTDQMKDNYKKYRHMCDAEYVHVNTDEGIHVSYVLDNEEKEEDLF